MTRFPSKRSRLECQTNRIITRYYRSRLDTLKENHTIKKQSRSRGISSFMMSILSLIHYLEEDAKKIGLVKNQTFYGIATSDIVKWFLSYFDEKNIIDNLYKLFRMRILLRKKIGEEYYYIINDREFFCKNGLYFFKYGKMNSISTMFMGFCDISHYCTFIPDKCIFHHIFSKKMQSFTSLSLSDIENSDIYNDLYNRIQQNVERYKNLDEYKKHLESYGINTKKMSIIEISYYSKYVNKLESTIKQKVKITQILKRQLRKDLKKETVIIENENKDNDYLKIIEKVKNASMIGREWTLNSFMISVLNLINLGREDAKIEGIEFPGFSMYQIERFFKDLWISHDTVYTNLYKLSRLNLVRKLYYIDDEKKRLKKNESYFDFNEDRFLCIEGIYLYYYPYANNEYKVFNGVCPYHHFCPDPKHSFNCKIVDIVKSIREMFNRFTESPMEKYLNKKIDDWKKDFSNYEVYSTYLEDILNNSIDYINTRVPALLKRKRIDYNETFTLEKIMNILTYIEKLHYGKNVMIYYDDEHKKKEIIDRICEIISSYIFIENRKLRKQKYKKREIKTTMTHEQLIRELILNFDKKKIRLS